MMTDEQRLGVWLNHAVYLQEANPEQCASCRLNIYQYPDSSGYIVCAYPDKNLLNRKTPTGCNGYIPANGVQHSCAMPGMSRAEFDHLIETDLMAYLRGLRDYKENEYAADTDTLLNFHRMGPFLNMTPSQYCMVLVGKHMQGIAHQIMRGQWLWAYRTDDGGEGLKQRIADAINYLCLLFALLHEEHEARHGEEPVMLRRMEP